MSCEALREVEERDELARRYGSYKIADEIIDIAWFRAPARVPWERALRWAEDVYDRRSRQWFPDEEPERR